MRMDFSKFQVNENIGYKNKCNLDSDLLVPLHPELPIGS